MDIIQAIILGIVQGLTEFLPISSSAHLVLVPDLIGVTYPNPATAVAFDTVLHIGTLVAVVGFFWKDIIRIIKALISSILDLFRGKFRAGLKEDSYKKLTWLLVVGTIPAGLAGYILKDQFTALFNSAPLVGFFLLITGVLLWLAEKVKVGHKNIDGITFKNALVIGIFQAFAIAPGISRSGATISAGLFSGLERKFAARYAFLLSIPAILGAAIVQIKDISVGYEANAAVIIAGFLASVIFGYLAIAFLLRIISRQKSLLIFAVYCWVVGALTLILSFYYGLI